MLGDFITRGLLLVLGYAYPAFECFKTVEKNKVDIEELRFWCQYWIIVALMTVFERIGDIFISWLPMYGEMKLALIIYLWYPKTKGTGYIYETLLRPYVATHESDIDRNLQELRGRAWDLAICYWQNCTQLGQTTFFQVLEYLAAQTGKIKKSNNEEEGWFTTSQKSKKTENHYPTSAAPPPSPSGSPSFHGGANKHPSDRRRPPLPPTPLGTTNRAVAQSPEMDVARAHLHSRAEFIQTRREHETDSSSGSGSGSTDESETGVEHRHAARLRLRRSKGFH